MTPRFDPTRALIMDLTRGQLRDEESTARLNLPAHLVLSLVENAGTDASDTFVHALGTELGRRTVERMGKTATQASVEAWTEHLGGQLALVGLGDLNVERWGRALILCVTGSPRGTAQLIQKVLSAALQRALSRSTEIVLFEDQMKNSYLVLSSAAADRARSLKQDGAGLGQIVEALHMGAA